METEEILKVPIKELGLSESFYASCDVMGLKTLEDVVFILPEKLVNKEGFSYTWLGELSGYLDKKGLLYLLQPLPGKSYG